ncbi:MAG: hypothetical protein JSV80_14840, partial [Acidobacteriota bacterium]
MGSPLAEAMEAHRCSLLYGVLAGILLLVAPLAHAQQRLPAAAPSLLERLDPGFELPEPRIRVALSVDDERHVSLGAERGRLRIIDGRHGKPVWPQRAEGPVLVVVQGEARPARAEVYR